MKYIITDETKQQQRPSTSYIQSSSRLTDESDIFFSMAPRLQKVVRKKRRDDSEISRCIKYVNTI